jgi:Family of unknown function (DUF5681)
VVPDNRLLKTGETGDAADGEAGAAVDAGGAGRDDAGRFRRGYSGNPAGRPRGRFRAGTQAAARLLDEQAETLALKAIEMALAGDPVAVRFCLGRILGVPRGQPAEFALPPIVERADLAGAVGAIAAAVADGSLTADEAATFAKMLDGMAYTLPRPEPEWPDDDDDDDDDDC